MELDKILKDLIKNEDVKMKKYVLFMMLKFSHLVKPIEDKNEYVPLLLLKNNRITLVYKDSDVEDLEYIFYDYEEILIILQKIFNENKNLYFYFEIEGETLSREEILLKIDESIIHNDKEMFKYYSSKLD